MCKLPNYVHLITIFLGWDLAYHLETARKKPANHFCHLFSGKELECGFLGSGSPGGHSDGPCLIIQKLPGKKPQIAKPISEVTRYKLQSVCASLPGLIKMCCAGTEGS